MCHTARYLDQISSIYTQCAGLPGEVAWPAFPHSWSRPPPRPVCFAKFLLVSPWIDSVFQYLLLFCSTIHAQQMDFKCYPKQTILTTITSPSLLRKVSSSFSRALKLGLVSQCLAHTWEPHHIKQWCRDKLKVSLPAVGFIIHTNYDF